jgi:hypothetical protein
MEAFVYIWKNLTNSKNYIGYHKGTKDDGYISSSSSKLFWSDFNNSSMIWSREIIHEGTRDECLQYEQQLLKSIDIAQSKWYNNARGSTIIFNDEVRQKIREHHLGKPSGMLGKTHSEETKKILKQKLQGRVLSEEHKANLRKPKASTEKYRKPKSEAHIEAMKKPKEKVECPHCKQWHAPANAKRWHFDNCKVK